MCAFHGAARRFVPRKDAEVEIHPWGKHLWLARPGLVAAKQLLMVEVDMPPGTGHQFHRHPEREELIYILDGEAEQWVDREKMALSAGDSAHIPADFVHGIYNVSARNCRFLAVLSPAEAEGPMLVDVHLEEPWRSLRTPLEETAP